MYPIIGPKDESVKGIIINPVEMYIKSAFVALKVDEFTNILVKLTISAARLQSEEKTRLVALIKSLKYIEPISQLDLILSRNNRLISRNYSDRALGEDRY